MKAGNNCNLITLDRVNKIRYTKQDLSLFRNKVKQVSIVLVTGSAGLIGSESVSFFCERGYQVVGIDNNMRQVFFGDDASTDWNRQRLLEKYGDHYIHHNADIRDEKAIEEIFKTYSNDIDLIIHTAAQPSHDWAAKEPYMDFTVNANEIGRAHV